MIARITDGYGGTYADSTITAASGENDGPGLLTIGGVAVAAYAVYKVLT